MGQFYPLILFILPLMQANLKIFDFKQEESKVGWYIVNDGVMGGLSEGQINFDGQQAVFKGIVSTKNNGGFTMVQNRFKTVFLKEYSKFVLSVKGDGKIYQFRVKSEKETRFSYVYEFQTSEQWQEISIPFSSLKPRFRGRSVDLPSFEGGQIEEVAFLVGNKRDESFKLQINSISAH